MVTAGADTLYVPAATLMAVLPFETLMVCASGPVRVMVPWPPAGRPVTLAVMVPRASRYVVAM
ncbi:hypothetical protein BXU09_18365 [Deinococcus sp. LM3]|nr:hypothetical protein BXU09_18365 [Deinococcus sp. LM3]